VRRSIVLLLVTFVLASGCRSGSGASTATATLAPGSSAKLKSTLRDLRGKPVVVNYWATWCGPCKLEMPRIVAAAKKYDDRVHFLGVDVEDDARSAADFVERYHMTFRSLADPKGEIRKSETLLGLPVTQFYGADGKLKFVHQGEIKRSDLEEKIEEVLRL
jgi:cytochrome c biogenesis protein CcmG/thiol:disulfide interchange protein DsbE